MEAIRQNGKIILHSDEGTSIRMIFKNLTGRNFQGQEYADYIRYIAIGTWDFRPASSSIAGTVRESAKEKSRMYEKRKIR